MYIFAVKIYLKAWIEASLAAADPSNNLKLFKSIQEHDSINHALAKSVLSTFCLHLWYLSEEIVASAIFDQSLSVGTKRLKC